MRVTQTISIGSLRINSMSNSAILQVGTSGAIKARSEDIKEYVTPAESDKKLEKKITKDLKPHLKKEGLPLETEYNTTNGGSGNNSTVGKGGGTGNGNGTSADTTEQLHNQTSDG